MAIVSALLDVKGEEEEEEDGMLRMFGPGKPKSVIDIAQEVGRLFEVNRKSSYQSYRQQKDTSSATAAKEAKKPLIEELD